MVSVLVFNMVDRGGVQDLVKPKTIQLAYQLCTQH